MFNGGISVVHLMCGRKCGTPKTRSFSTDENVVYRTKMIRVFDVEQPSWRLLNRIEGWKPTVSDCIESFLFQIKSLIVLTTEILDSFISTSKLLLLFLLAMTFDLVHSVDLFPPHTITFLFDTKVESFLSNQKQNGSNFGFVAIGVIVWSHNRYVCLVHAKIHWIVHCIHWNRLC